MTVTLARPAAPLPAFEVFFTEELLAEGPAGDWLLEGYLAPGTVTLLTGARKGVGKTTLLSVLLKRLETGGQLAGLAVRAAKAWLFPKTAGIAGDIGRHGTTSAITSAGSAGRFTAESPAAPTGKRCSRMRCKPARHRASRCWRSTRLPNFCPTRMTRAWCLMPWLSSSA
jgi:hypothetical protein